MEELYMKPVELGQPMLGFVLGEVIDSRNAQFKVGQLVTGLCHWSDYLVTDGAGFVPFETPAGVPLDLAFGVLAIAGPIAYFGLLDIGQPKQGETVVVTAAAGAVGSLGGSDRQDERLPCYRYCGLSGKM